MSTEFKREERYIVFKLADVEKDFFPSEISQLLRLYETQQSMRKQSGKPPLDCVVVEKDWPEYEPTWKAIEARVAGERIAPSVPEDFSREELEAVAAGLDTYEKTVNVGNVTGEGDDHLESTTAYAARFIRAKIAAMEQQKPARLVTPTAYRWRYRGAVKWQYGELTEEVARLAKEHNHEVQALGILSGAQTQPAPSVPTALLVAVADLVAQMEIVSRVGFVDTPDDKDSCAAFCVAEGTWLELMSAVESLTAALAATPEAKP